MRACHHDLLLDNVKCSTSVSRVRGQLMRIKSPFIVELRWTHCLRGLFHQYLSWSLVGTLSLLERSQFPSDLAPVKVEVAHLALLQEDEMNTRLHLHYISYFRDSVSIWQPPLFSMRFSNMPFILGCPMITSWSSRTSLQSPSVKGRSLFTIKG